MLPDRLLLTAEGDAAGDTGGGGGTGTAPPVTPPAAPAAPNGDQPAWYAPAESLKTSHPEIWSTFENGIKSGAIKDLPSLVVKGLSAEKKLGSALTLPGKDNAEELKGFKSKLTAGGVDLKALASEAPESPDKYEVKLDAIPEPLRSNDLMSEFRTIAHEEGLSQGTVNKLTGLYEKMFTGTIQPALKYTAEQGEAAINEFAKEIGKEPEVVKAYGGAWLKKHFSEEEMAEMDKSGFANSPVALKYAARAGLDTGEDISVIEGSVTATDNEYEDLMKNIGDPNHADYKMFHAQGIDPQDPKRLAFMAKRDQILQRKFGTGEVK